MAAFLTTNSHFMHTQDYMKCLWFFSLSYFISPFHGIVDWYVCLSVWWLLKTYHNQSSSYRGKIDHSGKIFCGIQVNKVIPACILHMRTGTMVYKTQSCLKKRAWMSQKFWRKLLNCYCQVWEIRYVRNGKLLFPCKACRNHLQNYLSKSS